MTGFERNETSLELVGENTPKSDVETSALRIAHLAYAAGREMRSLTPLEIALIEENAMLRRLLEEHEITNISAPIGFSAN